MKYDFFISHASEDKEAVVLPLVNRLKERGYSVWYDDDILRVGDSLLSGIDSGLSASRFGIAVLSPAFFAKHWTRQELQGLISLDEQGRSKILPVWHKLTKAEVTKHSPMLAGLVAATTSSGIDSVVEKLIAAAKLVTPNVSGEQESEAARAEVVPTTDGPPRPCAVFVHGLYSDPSAGSCLITLLQAEPDLTNWDFHSIGYSPGGLFQGASLNGSAALLVTYAEYHLLRAPKLVLIAHSMGGLIAMRAILTSESLRSRLAALILVAVPTNGLPTTGFSAMGLLGFFNRDLRDFGTGGRAISEMRLRWSQQFGTTPPFRVLSIFGDRDALVPAATDSLLDSPPITVPGSHTEIMGGASREDLIVQVIEHALRDA
ncbi:MAG: hypothetical protein QOE70_606 [Chthoniobacter sp.]|jgi:pimeloyl-ACP methyl ester carboxylesterase|nr:hypothetical protein [Chthoniobacter sp.]